MPTPIDVVLIPPDRLVIRVARRSPLVPIGLFPLAEDAPPRMLPIADDAVRLRPFTDGRITVNAALHDGVLYVSNNVRYADLRTVYAYASMGASTETEAAHQYHVRNLLGQPMYWCAFCEEWYRLLVDERPSCGCGHRKLVYRYQT